MICFHHNDADGRCAGAIIKKKFDHCRFEEMEYSKRVPFEKIQKDEEVYIVDFSFSADDMHKLLTITTNVIWIDHHKTILDHPFNNENIVGLRDIKHSGCYLTHKFIFPNYNIPQAIDLISDYDTWTLSLPNSKEFRFGLDLYPHMPDDIIWDSLLGCGKVYDEFVYKVCADGDIVLRFIDRFGQDYIKSYGFELKFEGYNCIAQGVYNFGSTFFGKLIDKYDICIPFEFTGQNWIVGLYSKKIDVSLIAKKYGGGGHKGAAGFVCDNLPFNKERKE